MNGARLISKLGEEFCVDVMLSCMSSDEQAELEARLGGGLIVTDSRTGVGYFEVDGRRVTHIKFYVNRVVLEGTRVEMDALREVQIESPGA